MRITDTVVIGAGQAGLAASRRHYRRSNLIGGVGRDAAFVADHIPGLHPAACACARADC